MRCIPRQQNTRAVGLCIAALLVCGGVFYAVPPAARAAGIRVWGLLFRALTFVCVIAAVWMLVRYLMTGFKYLIRARNAAAEDELDDVLAGGVKAGFGLTDLPPDRLDFVVQKSQGSRPGVTECVLGLDDLISAEIIRLRGKGSGPKKEDVRARCASESYSYYDYTLTFGLAEALMLVFADRGGYVGVIIEADEAMRAYFLSRARKVDPEYDPDERD